MKYEIVGWHGNEEKLLCLMVLDDTFAKELNVNAGPAYWRCFIVRNRATGKVSAKHRFKRADGSQKWQELFPQTQDEGAANNIRCAMEDVMRLGMELITNKSAPDSLITCFYPPDDGGDCAKTVDWLLEKDLIEVKRVDLDEPN